MNVSVTRQVAVTDPPEEIVSEISRRFTFENPLWRENRRMGRWNRNTPATLRFYEKNSEGRLVFPRGFAGRFLRFCKEKGIAYSLEDRRRTLDPVDMIFSGVLRPYQQLAADRILAKDFGTLSAPTGSGKTLIALYVMARRKQPSLVVTHTSDIARQWISRIEEFLGIPRAEVGVIGMGKDIIGPRVTVAMIQSLYKRVETVSPRIGHLVVDECHRTPSRTFTEAVSAFDARYMLGLTATPWRRDGLSELISLYLGDLRHVIDSARLVETGHILDKEVIYRETPFRSRFDPVREYSRMLNQLTCDDLRNRMIARDIAAEVLSGRRVSLVLSDRKRHLAALQSLLTFGHKISCGRLTGDMSAKSRQEVLERVDSGAVDVLFATGQLIGEGFDCKALSTLFITTPIRFDGRLVQYLGRILRPAPGKVRARVYDYVDSAVAPLASAARARRKVYESG